MAGRFPLLALAVLFDAALALSSWTRGSYGNLTFELAGPSPTFTFSYANTSWHSHPSVLANVTAVSTVSGTETELGSFDALVHTVYLYFCLSFSASLDFPLYCCLYLCIATAASLPLSLHLPLYPSTSISTSLRLPLCARATHQRVHRCSLWAARVAS